MTTAELVLRIASTGAVGVACLALYLWHRSFGDLVKFAGETGDTESAARLGTLSQQLEGYQKMMLVALAASVVVQLATPLIGLIGSRVHPVSLAVIPVDDQLKGLMPVLRKDNSRIEPDTSGAVNVVVDGKTSFLVDIAKMSAHIRELSTGQAQSAAQVRQVQTGHAPLGF